MRLVWSNITHLKYNFLDEIYNCNRTSSVGRKTICAFWSQSFLIFSDVDNVLQRMTIIGVLLCFRGLAQEALYDVSTENTQEDLLLEKLICEKKSAKRNILGTIT